ncbi:hypothetical protein MTHERMOG20_17570 [Moorella thermoacetica]|nr:hypothetical protein MTHERMOG20_17570 [Moorella thermoacetica]
MATLSGGAGSLLVLVAYGAELILSDCDVSGNLLYPFLMPAFLRLAGVTIFL